MKIFTQLATALCLLLTVSGNALGQTYPARTIRMLVGFPPGGGTDIIARIVAQKLSENLGQQVVVDNRAGASGILAAELTARAAPDGYTIMMAHPAAMAILPSLMPKLSYDPQKDFTAISLAATGPDLLVVHPSIPAKTVTELIAVAKARPGQLQYASAGVGTNLGGELLKLQGGIDMLHVPYKGSGQLILDLVAGHVHLNFAAIPVVLNYVRQGKLHAIAVTSPKRSSLLPGIPTFMESGIDIDMSNWWGLVAPSGVAKDVIERLHEETARVLRLADVKERIAVLGVEPVGNSPADFAAFIRSESTKYGRLIKATGIKID